MSYVREIPRDLFNEANLKKCYGQIYINLETANLPNVELVFDGEAFDVRQDPGSGAIYLENVKLMVGGTACTLQRPLNSREPWPLYLITKDYEEIDVFSADGSFSSAMLDFMRANSMAPATARPRRKPGM